MSRTWDVFHIWYRNTSFQYRTNLKLKSLSKPQVKYFFFLIGKQQSAEIQSKTTGLSLSQRSQCSKGRAEGRHAWQTGKPGCLLQLQWYWLPARGMDGQALTGLLSPTFPGSVIIRHYGAWSQTPRKTSLSVALHIPVQMAKDRQWGQMHIPQAYQKCGPKATQFYGIKILLQDILRIC